MSGLPWIKAHVDLPRHHKSIRLAARLEEPRAWTWVVELWFWAAEYQPEGVIECPDAELIITRGAGWKGDPDSFVRHLVAVGFLDKTPAGYAIHDWSDYAGAHVEKRRKDKDRKRKSRGGHADIQRTALGVTQESAREMEKERETTAVPPLARLPGKADALAKTYPATQAVLDALQAKGIVMAHASQADRRVAVEAACSAMPVERAAAAVEASFETKRKAWIGWHLEALHAAANTKPTAAVQGPDLSWVQSLPPDRQDAAMDAWMAAAADVESQFKPEARPRALASAAAMLRQEFAS